jgi:6-phosphogluconolactonase (cycloisomerase 2 family)
MPARHLLVASLSLLAAAAAAQTHYAWSAPTTRMAKVCTALPSTAKPARCAIRRWSSSLPNVAQLTVSRDGKTLYAASEVEKGVVQAWRIEANGELTELNQVSSAAPGRFISP